MKIVDMRDKEIAVGQIVAKAYVWGSAPLIDIRTVREIRDGKVYLDDSKVPTRFPERLLVL